MKIILASPRGFCAGVNMAIETLGAGARLFGTPVYVYHEIVHNKYVVERFRGRGGGVRRRSGTKCPRARRCSSPPTASRRRSAAIARERQLQTIDATCPLVTKVHLEAITYAKARLHDRADRPRRARRSDRHDGRSARGDRAGRDRPRTSIGWSCRRAQSSPI